MSVKNKALIRAIVGATVLLIMLLTAHSLIVLAEEEHVLTTRPVATERKVDPKITINDEFALTEDPYVAFSEAVNDEKPIVLEFYARW